MASRIEGKRETSAISNAQVSAVIGSTPGTVRRRLIRSASRGSRCSELTSAYSVFCSRTMVSRLSRSSVSRAVLNEAQVPSGNAHVWSFTADPKIGLKPHHGVGTYLIGAVGYYRRVVQFTQPTVQPVIIFDPFFGFVQGFVPADKVLGTIARGGVGGGAGAGFEFGMGPRSGNAKLFTEARYEYAATGAMPTRMVPVTFGIRW
jgi:hypothetical protein